MCPTGQRRCNGAGGNNIALGKSLFTQPAVRQGVAGYDSLEALLQLLRSALVDAVIHAHDDLGD